MNQRILLSIIAVTGALLFSNYGNAESQAQKKSSPSADQPLQKQLPNKAKGTISFKGIPLGKPGVKKALQKMCMEKKFNTSYDRCSFNDIKTQVLLNYESFLVAFPDRRGQFDDFLDEPHECAARNLTVNRERKLPPYRQTINMAKRPGYSGQI